MILLKYKSSYKDGGSKSYIDKDDNEYWVDFSINSKYRGTYGKLYKGNINNKNPILAKGKFILEERIITEGSVLIIKVVEQ